MKEREEVKLHPVRAELRNLVDESNDPISLENWEKVVHFEDEVGNVIIYPWKVLKESVLEWIEIEEREQRKAEFDGAGIYLTWPSPDDLGDEQ